VLKKEKELDNILKVLPIIPLSKKAEASKQSFWRDLIKIKLEEITKVK
jgi:hypothetical protein